MTEEDSIKQKQQTFEALKDAISEDGSPLFDKDFLIKQFLGIGEEELKTIRRKEKLKTIYKKK